MSKAPPSPGGVEWVVDGLPSVEINFLLGNSRKKSIPGQIGVENWGIAIQTLDCQKYTKLATEKYKFPPDQMCKNTHTTLVLWNLSNTGIYLEQTCSGIFLNQKLGIKTFSPFVGWGIWIGMRAKAPPTWVKKRVHWH